MDESLVNRKSEGVKTSEKNEDSKEIGSLIGLKTLARIVVYVGIFLLPLWFLTVTHDVIEFNKQVLLVFVVSVGLIFLLIDLIKNSRVVVRKSKFYIPLALLSVATVVVSLISLNINQSVLGFGDNRSFSLISILAFVVLFGMLLTLDNDRGKRLQKILTLSIGGTAIVAALKLFGLDILGSGAVSTVGLYSGLAALLAVSLPLFFVKPSARRENTQNILDVVRYAGLASIFLILLAVNWVTSWILVLLVTTAFIGFSIIANPNKRHLRFHIIPLIFIVVGVVMMISSFELGFLNKNLPVEVSPSQAISYDIALESLKHRPFGFGLENFSFAYDKYKSTDVANSPLFQTRFGDAASEFANIIIEGGILLLAVFLFLLSSFVTALYSQLKSKFNGDATNAGLWAMASGIFLLFFFIPANMTVMTMLFVVLAILSLKNEGSNQGESLLDTNVQSKYAAVGSVSFVVGLIAILSSGYFMMGKVVSNVYIAKAFETDNTADIVDNLVKAINYDGKNTLTYRLLSQALVGNIGALVESGPSGNVSRDDFERTLKNQIVSAVDMSVKATELSPNDSENWLNRGYVYQNLMSIIPDADALAVAMYRESLDLNPVSPLAYARIGNTYLASAQRIIAEDGSEGDVDTQLARAEENYLVAISLYNNYGQALYNLGVIYDQRSEIPQAIQQFERLILTDPQNPSIAFQLGLLYYRGGRKLDAIAAWERAVLLFPKYSNARWYLSLAYEEQGDIKNALAQAKEILKSNSTNTLVSERVEALERGEPVINSSTDLLGQEPLNNIQ